MRDVNWFDLGDGAGVLEVPEAPDALALELYVVQERDTGTTIAWWETDEGVYVSARPSAPRELEARRSR
jgi:hypothetical protein